ncbi:MAG: hypothetical protein KA098_06380 [Phenylobacterium sp.]|nr:hypothetical protein [Phenylobacterium sp.]
MWWSLFRSTFTAFGILIVSGSTSAAQELDWMRTPAVSAPGSADRLYPFFAAGRELAAEGYIEEEWFVAGHATPLSAKYGVEPGHAAVATGPAKPFKTRVLVRRPDRPVRFNGVVVVEWLNVSNGFEADNVWLALQDHLVGAGYIWVGVSAQGFGGSDALWAWSPARYAGLSIEHGGAMAREPLSLDIFRQVVESLRGVDGAAQLGGLMPTTLIATGQSQGAIWLSGLINAGIARRPYFDGFLLVSGTGAKIDTASPFPVLRIVAEGDAAGADAEGQAQDTARFRQWEIAGSSHVDRHLRAMREPIQMRDLGTSVQAAIAPRCTVAAIGTTTPAYMVEVAGLSRLVIWARGGPPPRSAPRLARRPDVDGRLQRDANGVVLGGIRLPDVAAPVGVNVGKNNGAPACGGQGYYQAFDVATLRRLYPSTGRYRQAVARNVRENIAAGYLLPADGELLMRAARKASW